MITATIDSKEYNIEFIDNILTINKDKIDWKVTKNDNKFYNILADSQSFEVELISFNRSSKNVTLKVNNTFLEVSIADELDNTLRKMGIHKMATKHQTGLKAPMPGLIVDVMVNENDEIKAGQPLIVLEAMKMENVLKAQEDGKVKTLKIKQGDRVEKNQVLMEF